MRLNKQTNIFDTVLYCIIQSMFISINCLRVPTLLCYNSVDIGIFGIRFSYLESLSGQRLFEIKTCTKEIPLYAANVQKIVHPLHDCSIIRSHLYYHLVVLTPTSNSFHPFLMTPWMYLIFYLMLSFMSFLKCEKP